MANNHSLPTDNKPATNTNAAANKASTIESKPAASENKQKPELSSLTVNAPEEAKKPFLTIAEKLQKLEEFNELVERREILMDSKEKLKVFYISETGSANLKLTDSKGNSFAISHPIIIGEMVHMATERLTKEVAEIEEKINFYF